MNFKRSRNTYTKNKAANAATSVFCARDKKLNHK